MVLNMSSYHSTLLQSVSISITEDYWKVRFSLKCERWLVITMLASCADPLSFGYNTKWGKVGYEKGGAGDNNILRRLAKQMLML